MAGNAAKNSRSHPEKLGDFLDAAYCLETDDQTWLADVMDRASAVWGRVGPVQGAIYDASDVTAFRVKNAHLMDFCDKGVHCIMDGLKLITPDMVTRTFRSTLAGSTSYAPEMLPMLGDLGALGFPDALNINGLDPSGLGVVIALWKRARREEPAAELALYRRMAHHLGAAHRCRRRLHESQLHRSSVDATDGAEAGRRNSSVMRGQFV